MYIVNLKTKCIKAKYIPYVWCVCRLCSFRYPSAFSLICGLLPVVRPRRALLTLSEMQSFTAPPNGDIFPVYGVRRRYHIAFQLLEWRNGLKDKPDVSRFRMVDVDRDLHQLRRCLSKTSLMVKMENFTNTEMFRQYLCSLSEWVVIFSSFHHTSAADNMLFQSWRFLNGIQGSLFISLSFFCKFANVPNFLHGIGGATVLVLWSGYLVLGSVPYGTFSILLRLIELIYQGCRRRSVGQSDQLKNTYRFNKVINNASTKRSITWLWLCTLAMLTGVHTVILYVHG